jgi:hypothetical protein
MRFRSRTVLTNTSRKKGEDESAINVDRKSWSLRVWVEPCVDPVR